MSPTIISIYIFVLACFIGYYVIWGVTPALHTPLMAVTNAISAIVIVGAMLVAGSEHLQTPVGMVIGFFAVFLASINIFGGFVVTNRMLALFKMKPTKEKTKK
jgi:NAD(P) transhydrogenase subunit alpha